MNNINIEKNDIYDFFRYFLLENIRKTHPSLEDRFIEKCVVESPKDQSHGDFSTNIALILSKPLNSKPQILALSLKALLDSLPFVMKSNIAGPGFLNWEVDTSYWVQHLQNVLQQGNVYGYSDVGQGKKVNIEYVSANPTGPLHIAHARGAVVGDVLATLLEKAGYDVVREYYINDAGAQVQKLAQSTYLRYLELYGEEIALGDDAYPGSYIVDIAKAIQKIDGEKWRYDTHYHEYFQSFAIKKLMETITSDLRDLGVEHDIFTSEKQLILEGKVESVLDVLHKKGLIYTGVLEKPKGKPDDEWEERPQTLFRASDYGDTVDRPLKKSDGSWTYFTSDIANHFQKYLRGAKTIINVWGADHAGYIKRCDVALSVLTDNQSHFDVKVCQLVRLLNDGQVMKMSKRSGNFVTLKSLIDQVGKDVVRFIMLTRRNDQHLDFDLQKVVDQSKDNPIFYVQYAHARCNSVIRAAKSEYPSLDLDPSRLFAMLEKHSCFVEEVELLKKILTWPRVFSQSVAFHEPHRIAYYLYELASAFHSLWNKGKDNATLRFVHVENEEITLARLAIITAVKNVIASGLEIFSIKACEQM